MQDQKKTNKDFIVCQAAIFEQRRSYYDALENAQKGGLDITAWVLWFLNCANTALQNSYDVIILSLKKESFWKKIRQVALNERQTKVLNMLFDGFEGKLTTSKYAKINQCSQDTAHRDLLLLIDKGLVQKSDERGRNVHYFLNEEFINQPVSAKLLK